MWAPNLYDTTSQRFSEFGLAVSGVIYHADVFISSLAEFVAWFNKQSPYKLVQQPVDSYRKVFSFTVTNGVGGPQVTTGLIGDGWRKLGFTDLSAKPTHTGTRIFDLSLSPQVLVRLSNPNIKAAIQSTTGQAHYTLPNVAAFGGKLLYQNDMCAPNRNTIFLEAPLCVGSFDIELLNCDFAPLYTCDFGAGRDNNDAEVVLVFATRK